MSTTDKPRAAPTPELAGVMSLVMPLSQGFMAESAKLPPNEQTRRVQKVLAAFHAR
jgi:hypothetical protein